MNLAAPSGRPVVKTKDGLRALSGTKPSSPEGVQRYLEGKFGDDLERANSAMAKLAGSMPPQKLAAAAYKLYEEFRPSVPAGVSGWGAKGKLNLDAIKKLARRKA